MKKTLLAVLMTTAGFTGMVEAASTGTINFNGELTATTCDADVDAQGPDATIVLPTLGTNQLKNAGETAGRTNFVINLTNCSGSLKNAAAYFEKNSGIDDNGRLKNVGGTAGNVVLSLRDDSNTDDSANQIFAGNSIQLSDTHYQDTTSGSAQLPYSVEYYAEGATTAGTVVGSVVYSIMYK